MSNKTIDRIRSAVVRANSSSKTDDETEKQTTIERIRKAVSKANKNEPNILSGTQNPNAIAQPTYGEILKDNKRGMEIREAQKIQKENEQDNWQAVIDSAALGLDNFTTGIYKTLGLGNEYIRKYTDPVYMLTKKAFGTTPTDYMVETAKLGNEMRKEKAEQSNANASETVQAINQYVTEPVFETLPSTVLAIMSGGASAAGSGISQAANAAGKANAITNTLSNTVKSVVTNPSFYVSVASTYGPTYYDAKEMGATDAEALWVATISSAIGSAIEVGAGDVGGGLEKFVRNGNTRGLWEWVKSALEEGGEEVLQGIVDRATKATIISNPKEQMAFYSSDPNQPAVINPNTMAQEFIGGVTVSAILGGGTKLFGTAVNFVNNQQSGGSYDYSGNVQETAKAAGFTDTEVINQVAEWSARTKTPVLFTDKTFTDPVSGTQVDAIESDGVVFLSTKATNPMLELVVHEIAHTAQNTAQYQALLAEVKQSGMFASAGSWENAVARYQQYYAQEYNINYSFEQAQAEMVAKYIGENLYKSPESQKFVRQYMNGGLQRMLANRSYRQQYRAADAQGQQRLRQERALAEALRNRQNLTPEQIYATQQRIAEGDLTGAQFSTGNSRLADILSGARDIDAEYQEAIDTYGAMNLDRSVETPKRVDDSGQKVSQAASTFLNNSKTQQEATVIKGGIVDGLYNHDTLKIEAAKEKARARIDGVGYEAAAKDVAIKAADDDADAMLSISPADYVYYGELYDMAVAQGDYETAENCLLIMFEAASNSGKILAIQRNRMRNMLNGISRSRAIQRDIARINNGFSAKYIEKHGRIEIPTEMYETLEKAKTPEEIESAEAAIYDKAAEQWKATAWEKWRNYRYLAMLGNLKTWNKNTASNWANFGLSHSDNLISAAWQKMWGKFDFEKASVILWNRTELGKQIQPDVHARAQEMAEAEANHKYQDSPKSEIESRRKKFGDSKVGQLLEKASEGTDKIMQTGVIETVTKGKRGKKISGGDKAMFARAWEFYAGNYMVANNLTEITVEVENYATKAAQELVFHSDNAISKTVQKIRQSSKGAAAIIDFAMPFVKTPANVLQQGFQRSPVGLITNGIKLVKEMNASHKSGGKVSAETLNKFSRGVTGSMLMALGMLLSSLGIASGKEDESAKGRAGSELGGSQPLSFNVFGTSISFDWLEPASYPFLVGVLFEQGLEESDTSGAVIDAICAGYNEIFDMSMLAGLTEIFQQGSYGQDKNMIGDAAAKLLTNAVTQSIPTVVGQLARTIDPVKRKTTSGDSVFTDVLGDNFLSDTASTIAARIPFASKLLEPERDVWGNEVGRSGDSALLNAVNQFVSPAALNSGSGYDDDLVTQIVMDLYERTGDAKVIPTELDKNKAREELGDDYNSKTFQELRQEVGDAQYEAIYELITSGEPMELYDNYTDANGKQRRKKYNKTFDEMTDAEKVKVISSAASKAKTSAIEDYVEAFENILP